MCICASQKYLHRSQNHELDTSALPDIPMVLLSTSDITLVQRSKYLHYLKFHYKLYYSNLYSRFMVSSPVCPLHTATT